MREYTQDQDLVLIIKAPILQVLGSDIHTGTLVPRCCCTREVGICCRFHVTAPDLQSWFVCFPAKAVWFLVGNGGMGYGDYYWGLYRRYHRDPFPHSY